jgi:hypothetical protein
MSEKIYARFLHLYPSRFREAYGEEALQLFRDRARHERGLFRRLRLWNPRPRRWTAAASLPSRYWRTSGLASTRCFSEEC